jgi:hypothetical protein
MMVDVVIKEIFKDIGNSIIYELKTIKNYLTPSWLWGGKPGTGQPVGPQQESEKHSSLVPPPRHMAINIPVTVQMDGRKMASTVMNQVVASATYPTSASGADGRGQWLGPSAYATEQG